MLAGSAPALQGRVTTPMFCFQNTEEQPAPGNGDLQLEVSATGWTLPSLLARQVPEPFTYFLSHALTQEKPSYVSSPSHYFLKPRLSHVHHLLPISIPSQCKWKRIATSSARLLQKENILTNLKSLPVS